MADITATVITDNSTTATVKAGTTVLATKISEGASSMLQNLSDVDASVLSDGSMIIYDEPNKKFKQQLLLRPIQELLFQRRRL